MIVQTKTTSFLVELFQAVHNFGPTSPNTFYIALYDSTASLGADTTVYTTTGEITGTGYTAGGIPLTISTSPTSGTNSSNEPVAYLDFADASWPAAAFTTLGALIYNSSQGNKAVCVLNFGADKTPAGQTFTVVFPSSDADSAIIRIQ